ncbi:hypothetical protein [Patulibacter sp. SYSU D01012]|uniref:hypothetical protein n=1 Tax=Patulibacter sp. SYSU D01012 TaxID=2817381 RepID=UPI001B31495C|nr:hypothetical protein [Patulibacter sp. SYSU D01012]
MTPARPAPAPVSPGGPRRSGGERVDIRPTAELLRVSVERAGIDATCARFRLCRRRLGAIVALRTTRGTHAHFLDRRCVEDILTHGPEAFDALHVPLDGTLQARLTELLQAEGADALAARLGVTLPRAGRFVEQLVLGRAGNGATVTHVCSTIAVGAGIDPATLRDHVVERGWCARCEAEVLAGADGACPWCDAPVGLPPRRPAGGPSARSRARAAAARPTRARPGRRGAVGSPG